MAGLTAAVPDVVTAMIRAAEAAGEVAMRYYRGGFEVTIKPDQTPVTQADREAEQAIKAILRRACPDHGFLGEEFGEEGPKERRFIIDPIDGTKNFIRRVPIWAVLIGLEEAGQVTAGVVLNPASGEMFWAHRGDGAWDRDGRLRVSDCGRLAEATVLHSDLHLLRQGSPLGRFRANRRREPPQPRLRRLLRLRPGRRGQGRALPGGGSQALGRGADADAASRRRAAGSPTSRGAPPSTTARCWPPTAGCTSRSWPCSVASPGRCDSTRSD